MGKSKKNDNFERGMHRDEDDLGYMDQGLSDDMTITPDAISSGESANANTATMQQAKTKTQQDQQTSMQQKRGNQPEI